MLKTRYNFIKRLYKDYIIIFKKNNNNYIYDYDFLYLFKDKINIINKLNKYHINYIIIDNVKIINIKKYSDNLYNYYNNRYIIYKVITNK